MRIFITALLLALNLFPFSVRASDSFEHCTDVLRYTGREETIIKQLHMESYFASQISQTAKSLDITTPKGVLGYEGSEYDGNTQSRQLLDDYYRKSDVVFGPAVDAWKSCVLAAKAGMKVTAKVSRDAKQISLIFTPDVHSNPRIQGIVVPKGLQCKSVGDEIKIKRNMNYLVQDRILHVSCDRIDNAIASLSIGVTTNGQTFDFTLPALAGEAQAYQEASAHRLYISGNNCVQDGFIPPVNFRREVKIFSKMFGKYNRESSLGSVDVAFNGISAAHPEKRKQPGWNPRGEFSQEDLVWIDAFTPVLVRSVGGVEDGDCVDIGVEIKGPV